MLNRRIIRMRAMQYYFAWQKCKGANQLLAEDQIAEDFAPDDFAEIAPDKPFLEKQRTDACSLLQELINKTPKLSKYNNDVHTSANKAYLLYKSLNNQDKNHVVKTAIANSEDIISYYLSIFKLLQEIVNLIKLDSEDKNKEALRGADSTFWEVRFLSNKAYAYLLENKPLQNMVSRKGVDWDAHEDIVRRIYSDLRKDETFKAYINLVKFNDADFEADKAIIDYIFKTFFFKNETLQTFFDDADLNWCDHKAVTKSMVTKTLKLVNVEDPQADIYVTLSAKWDNTFDNDKAYFVDLLTAGIEQDDELEAIVTSKLENWDLERLVQTDQLTIKLAIAEMIKFPSIPLKVSINEYIEVAKHYSTPKSKQFVNGILDKISADLVAQGKVIKSGRGLIEN